MNLPAFLMGYHVLPVYFTKILKPPLSTLHKQGHIVVAHLDDLYLQGQTYEKCVQNVIDTTVLLGCASRKVHPNTHTSAYYLGVCNKFSGNDNTTDQGESYQFTKCLY